MDLHKGFLASCRRNRERQCASEMYYILTEKLGFLPEQVQADRTLVSGLTVVKLNGKDPVEAIEELKAFVNQEENGYYLFVETDKLVPIQAVTPTNIEDITEMVLELVGDRKGKWRVTINKRYNTIEKDEVIKAIATKISNPVSLTDFDWEVRIEIVGGKTGISVLTPDQVLRISKNKLTSEKQEGNKNDL